MGKALEHIALGKNISKTSEESSYYTKKIQEVLIRQGIRIFESEYAVEDVLPDSKPFIGRINFLALNRKDKLVILELKTTVQYRSEDVNSDQMFQLMM